jgi:hypothetical protein
MQQAPSRLAAAATGSRAEALRSAADAVRRQAERKMGPDAIGGEADRAAYGRGIRSCERRGRGRLRPGVVNCVRGPVPGARAQSLQQDDREPPAYAAFAGVVGAG